MTQQQREYLARTNPNMLAQYDRGDIAAVSEWLSRNGSAIGEWTRANPESDWQRRERERFQRECEGAGGW